MQSICAVFYCHMWSICFHNIMPHYLINGTTYSKSHLNLCFDFLQNFFLKYFSLQEKLGEVLSQMHIRLNVNVYVVNCVVVVHRFVSC